MKLIDLEEPYKVEIELNGHKCSVSVIGKLVDAIPVVRCKECRFRDTFNCGMQFYGYDDDMNLRKSDDWTMDDGFCYWGERKDV